MAFGVRWWAELWPDGNHGSRAYHTRNILHGTLAGMAMISSGVSFTSIFTGDILRRLLRIPGTPASGPATLDGYELTKQGRGMEALTLDLLCSAIGGFIGVFILMLVAPPLAKFALRFTNFQYFWLGIFGLSMSDVTERRETNERESFPQHSALLVATIGMDVTTGLPRFTGGNMELLEGVGFIPAMVGLFGLSEVLKNVADPKLLKQSSIPEFGKFRFWEE